MINYVFLYALFFYYLVFNILKIKSRMYLLICLPDINTYTHLSLLITVLVPTTACTHSFAYFVRIITIQRARNAIEQWAKNKKKYMSYDEWLMRIRSWE